jgi:two-component system, NtrC family, sensor kinase
MSAYLYPNSELGLPEDSYHLTKRVITVGRHPNNDVSILLESVSRFHARLEQRDGGWVLTDLNSSNGTFVNGERLATPRMLASSDLITFGRADFTFSTQDPHARRKRSQSDSTQPTVVAEKHTSSVNIVGDDLRPSLILSTQLSIESTPLPGRTIVEQGLPDIEGLRKANERLTTLYKLTEVIRTALTSDEVLQNVMRLIFDILPADRGVILMGDGAEGHLEPRAVKYRDTADSKEVTISRTIISKCRDERVAILSRDAKIDTRFGGSASIIASDIRSAMCVPLISKKKLIGILFLDTRESVRAFNEDDLTFISSLANDVALTLDNLALAEENIKNERLAAVGQTIAGLAHNIKNILQLAKGGMELMDTSISKGRFDDVEAYWPVVRRGIDRMQSLTQEMLAYSRQTRPPLKEVSVNDVIQETVASFEKESMQPGVTLDIELAPDLPVRSIDPDGLMKSLLNLIGNAIDAFEGMGGNIRVATVAENQTILVNVEDNGRGIPRDKMSRIFQPFFTTKGSKGTGLGLSMTRKYIEDMGGSITVDSEEGRGTKFTIALPPLVQEMRYDLEPEQVET